MKTCNAFLVTVLTLCGLLFSIHSYGFVEQDFHKLTIQDGLSDNKVNCIFRDRDGVMWMGTNYGISRYDGVSIDNFTIHDSFNHVTSICQLGRQLLSVCIDSTFYAFNQLVDEFVPIDVAFTTAPERVIGIQMKDDRECWVVGERHVYLCSLRPQMKQGKMVRLSLECQGAYPVFPSSADGRITCYAWVPEADRLYLTGSNAHLVAFDLKSRKVASTVYIPRLPERVTSILKFKGYVWIGTIANGLVRYQEERHSIDYFSYHPGAGSQQLSHTDVYGIVPIGARQLLLVTWNGYTVFTSPDDSFDRFSSQVYNNVSLSGQNIETRMIAVYYDSQGMLWIGTHGGGVLYASCRLPEVGQFQQDQHNEICGITADREGYLWLATFHKGVMKSRRPFSPGVELDFVQEKSWTHGTTVLCLFHDERSGDIWLGTQDGEVCIYRHADKTVKTFRPVVEGAELKAAIHSLLIDTKRRVWIGTEKGLLLWDEGNRSCKRAHVRNKSTREDNLIVSSIVETRQGDIWIGTVHNGLGKLTNVEEGIDLGFNETYRLNTISVRSLLAASDGKLYIGYAEGLAVMDLETEKIENFYTTQNGLCNNFIGCILEDAHRQIWIGNNSCISKFSRKYKLFFHYFVSGSNKSAYCYGNYLFWGNNKSLTYFDPERINGSDGGGKIIVNSVEVGNKKVKIGESINGQVILEKSLAYTDTLSLNDRNRDFSLSFSNLSYSDRLNKMRYRLYPYQKEWIVTDAGKGEKVSYNNLGAGEYVFEIQRIYPDEHTEPVKKLAVQVLPHWSETLYFRLFLVGLLLVGLAGLLHRFSVRQRRLWHELQLEQEVFRATVERDKEKQMRMERERFFMHIAHELRTPLTLIIAPLKEILDGMPEEAALKNPLSMIYKNSQSLHVLIDHLLYLRKIESGMVKLQVSEVDVARLVREVSDTFVQLAETNRIRYTRTIPQTPCRMWGDAEKMVFAVRNLLSNAFKYTPCGGDIAVTLREACVDGNAYYQLTVADTGKGIPEELQERIFDSFVTDNETPVVSTGMGIGLHIVQHTMNLHHGVVSLKSKAGEGSAFTLSFPKGKECFEDDDNCIVFPAEEANGPAMADDKQKYSLLIIEDNTDVRQYIRSLFCKEYVVYEAANGEEGVDMALQKLPSFIISDIMMPVKDGLACCKEIRENAKTAHIPILMLTAREEETTIVKANQLGVDDYVVKPFNPEVLQSKVKSLLLQRERLKRIYAKMFALQQYEEGSEETDAREDFIGRVVQVIEANIANKDFNVKQLAEQLNVSQPTLYRKMKKATNVNAIDMIVGIRMSKAAVLMIDKRYSIQEIAELVGYSDIRTLRKHFIEQFGISPSQYQEEAHQTS